MHVYINAISRLWIQESYSVQTFNIFSGYFPYLANLSIQKKSLAYTVPEAFNVFMYRDTL
jgi:hypothetical protein